MAAREKQRSDFGSRMHEARKAAQLTQQQAARAMELSQSTISELELKAEGSTLVVQFARLYGCSADWLATGDGSPHDYGGQAIAHPVSLSAAETVPSITWEQAAMGEKSNELPRVFRIPIESGEMAPRVNPGSWVLFASHLKNDAKPGDGVLVRDSAGGLHFRVYRAGRLGTWEAHAENQNFQPLLSERDGLSVLAVLTAVEGRWC